MDREILFRGKRLDKFRPGEWIYGYYVPCCFGSFPCRPAIVPELDGQWEPFEVDPSTVGQYTGLTDKNGKKIFDGDIVAAGYYKWKCQVVWDARCARFICYTLEGERRIVYVDMTGKDDKSALEVIGSVHDYPELMGGEGDG